MYLIIKIVFATIFLFFFLKSLKDSLVYPDPEGYISVIEKSQKLLKKLICDATFQDLNFIGKLTFSGLSVIHFNKLQKNHLFFLVKITPFLVYFMNYYLLLQQTAKNKLF